MKDAAEATGINLPAVLRAMNERLEYLIDRDHLIGHAWLIRARSKADVDLPSARTGAWTSQQ